MTAVVGWRGAFFTAAAIMAVMLVVTFFLPREAGEESHESPFRGIAKWLARPHAAVFLAIALLYRLGEVSIVPMVKPFWVDKGFSAAEIGTVTTVVGLSCLIAGAFAGGAVVSRFGIWRALIWLGVLQVISNAGYAFASAAPMSRKMFYSVVVVENFCGGLGTAAFLAFLMAICDREYAATQYALLSAAFSLTRFVAGTFSGFLAQSMGYTNYFWLTLFLGIPGLLLVPLIRGDELLAPRTRDIVAET
jgi:PAT family beta-lactamase induction signal transducer AmpG